MSPLSDCSISIVRISNEIRSTHQNRNQQLGPNANGPLSIGTIQMPKKPSGNFEDSLVRKLMLDSWNQSIFSNIKRRLQDSAMKLVHAERNGDAFDSQLVIGVRESYVNLCSNNDDKLKIYRDNFEASYLQVRAQFSNVGEWTGINHNVCKFLRPPPHSTD